MAAASASDTDSEWEDDTVLGLSSKIESEGGSECGREGERGKEEKGSVYDNPERSERRGREEKRRVGEWREKSVPCTACSCPLVSERLSCLLVLVLVLPAYTQANVISCCVAPGLCLHERWDASAMAWAMYCWPESRSGWSVFFSSLSFCHCLYASLCLPVSLCTSPSIFLSSSLCLTFPTSLCISASIGISVCLGLSPSPLGLSVSLSTSPRLYPRSTFLWSHSHAALGFGFEMLCCYRC